LEVLQGIRILELSRVAPGSYATMILGDMGAEVIKVEQPIESDIPRVGSGWSPVGEEGRKDAAYMAIHRNKKSIAIDLKSEDGREIFYRLAGKADVLLEGFRPGVAKRLKIDYETLREINPRIIYCSLTGYGQNGPYRELPGHDINYIGYGGALGLIGRPGEPPIPPLNLVGDFAGGSLNCVIGILLAIIARQKTGKGQQVDISMTDGVVSLLTWMVSDYFKTGVAPKRGEYFLSGGFPCYSVFETRDRKFIAVGCIEPWLWANLCRALGKEEFVPFQWANGEKRIKIMDRLREIFLTKSRDEWIEFLKDKDVCVSKVNDFDEVFRDPQILHRRMVIEMDHPSEGKVKQVGIAIKLSDTPGRVKSFGPILGEHTQEILGQLGYSKKEINKFLGAKIVG